MLTTRGSLLLAYLCCLLSVCCCYLCCAQPSLPPSLAGPFDVSQSANIQSTTVQLTPEQRQQLVDSANASHLSLYEAEQILQLGMRRGLISNVPPTAEPASCAPVSHECQFYKACFPCYANHMLSQCLPCLDLKECGSFGPCQNTKACKVCETLPAGSYRPDACHLLHC